MVFRKRLVASIISGKNSSSVGCWKTILDNGFFDHCSKNIVISNAQNTWIFLFTQNTKQNVEIWLSWDPGISQFKMIASNPRGTATCSKCRASHYCGQACQRRSWASPSVKLKPLSHTRSCGSLRSVITSHDVVSQVWRACWSDLGHLEMPLQISVLPGEILDCIRIQNDQIPWNSAIASTYLMKLLAMFHHFKLTCERQFVSRATLVPQILAFKTAIRQTAIRHWFSNILRSTSKSRLCPKLSVFSKIWIRSCLNCSCFVCKNRRRPFQPFSCFGL